jgi:ketosteroid isomerase-like protein
VSRDGGDPPPGAAATAAAEVEAAHRGYYAAWEAGNLRAVADAWLEAEDVCCVFPGAEPHLGSDDVRRLVTEGVELTPGIQFLFEQVDVTVRGDVARLSCVENVVTADTFSLSDVTDLPATRMGVTSTFVRTPDGWRLWLHTVGPVITHLDLED